MQAICVLALTLKKIKIQHSANCSLLIKWLSVLVNFLWTWGWHFSICCIRRLVFNISSRRSMPPRLPRYHMLCMPLLQNLVRKISYDNFRYCIIFNCFATCEDFLMHASMHAQSWQCEKKTCHFNQPFPIWVSGELQFLMDVHLLIIVMQTLHGNSQTYYSLIDCMAK